MVVGVQLGPSLLGAVPPDFQAQLFLSNSFGILQMILQIGICLYIFCVGLEFRLDLVRTKAGAAFAISSSGICPFLVNSMLVLVSIVTTFMTAPIICRALETRQATGPTASSLDASC